MVDVAVSVVLIDGIDFGSESLSSFGSIWMSVLDAISLLLMLS